MPGFSILYAVKDDRKVIIWRIKGFRRNFQLQTVVLHFALFPFYLYCYVAVLVCRFLYNSNFFLRQHQDTVSHLELTPDICRLLWITLAD